MSTLHKEILTKERMLGQAKYAVETTVDELAKRQERVRKLEAEIAVLSQQNEYRDTEK